MIPLNQLRDQLFKNLSEWSLLDEFFRTQLQNRVNRENWLENSLIQIILLRRKPNIDLLNSLLSNLKEDRENYNRLKTKLSSQERDYDEKLSDLLAEVAAYEYLKDRSFNNIKALDPLGAVKTPDFQAEKTGKTYLFEVKKMRSPLSGMDYVFDKIHARLIQEPELYNNRIFHIELPRDTQGEVFNDSDKLAITEWLLKLSDALRLRLFDEPVMHSWFKEMPNRKLKKVITCTIKEGEFDVIGHHGRRGILRDQNFRKANLMAFTKKLLQKAELSVAQLLEYDKNDDYDKQILINWQVPKDMIFIREEAFSIADSISCILKNITKKLSLVILNRRT